MPAEFISTVTDAVMAEVTAGQARPLKLMYPVVFFFDVYLALGVQYHGTRDILGQRIQSTEGAKFWMKVFNDLRIRGVTDILITVTDGLMGMQEALATLFPAPTLQACIVRLIRNRLDFAS